MQNLDLVSSFSYIGLCRKSYGAIKFSLILFTPLFIWEYWCLYLRCVFIRFFCLSRNKAFTVFNENKERLSTCCCARKQKETESISEPGSREMTTDDIILTLEQAGFSKSQALGITTVITAIRHGRLTVDEAKSFLEKVGFEKQASLGLSQALFQAMAREPLHH